MSFNAKHLFILCLVVLTLASCQDDDIVPLPEQEALNVTTFQRRAVDYFLDVALGFEYSNASQVVRKWSPNNPVYLYVSGDTTTNLMEEVNATVNELLELTSPQLSISTVDNLQGSNAHLVFGSEEAFLALYPEFESDIRRSLWGMFSVWFDSRDYLYRSAI